VTIICISVDVVTSLERVGRIWNRPW
jgi:hypothetical protein